MRKIMAALLAAAVIPAAALADTQQQGLRQRHRGMVRMPQQMGQMGQMGQMRQMRQRGQMIGAGIQVGPFAPDLLLRRSERLGLDESQVSQLEELAANLEEARTQAVETANDQRDRLAEAWRAGEPDLDAIRTHASAVMAANHTAQLTMIESAVKARALLSDEQRGRISGWRDAQRAASARGRMRAQRGRAGRPGRSSRRCRGPGR